PPEERRETQKAEQLFPVMKNGFVDDPDAGIHSSAEWFLRQWDQENEIRTLQEKLRGKPADTKALQVNKEGQTLWEVNKQGQTLVIIPKDQEFIMGSTEPGYPEEPPHRKRIPRSYAIGTKEVTVAQFEEFLNASDGWKHHGGAEA